jgi:hypothetical protein
MFRRYAWAGLAALATYGAAYLLAWFVVWDVPVAERDGLEWLYVFLLTLPWSLLAGVGGWMIVQTGALINGVVLSVVVGRTVKRRWPDDAAH